MNNSPHGFASHVMIYTVFMIGFTASIGLATVSMRHQISVTANATRALNARIAETERRLTETTAAAEAERDPNALLMRNAEWHLGLTPPTQAQIVHMTEDPVRRLTTKRDRGAFSDGAAAVSLPLATVRR